MNAGLEPQDALPDELSEQRKRRFPWLGLIVIVAAATLAVWTILAVGYNRTRLVVKTCFNDAQGLQEKAQLRLAGVEVGYVNHVRANPANRNCPAEVQMNVTAPYDLRIPRDSVVSIRNSGVLGSSFVHIDVSKALGAPIESGGTLPSLEEQNPSVDKLVDLIVRYVRKQSESSESLPTASKKGESQKERKR